MTYKYTSPLDRGYKKAKLTRKDHNEVVYNRRKGRFTRIDMYYNNDGIILEYSTNIMGKLLVTLLLPFIIIGKGMLSVGDILDDYKKMMNERKYGSFISEYMSSRRYDGKPNEMYHKLKVKGGVE